MADETLMVAIAGVPSRSSDDAVAAFFERFLATEQPGTTWALAVQRPLDVGGSEQKGRAS